MKFYLVVNINKIMIYQKYKVEKILNKKDIKEIKVFGLVKEIYNKRKHLKRVEKLKKYNRLSKRI